MYGGVYMYKVGGVHVSLRLAKWQPFSKIPTNIRILFARVNFLSSNDVKPLEEIEGNCTKRKRATQTTWQCKTCGPCCKKKLCWNNLHELLG